MDRNYLEMLLASVHFTPRMILCQLDRFSKAIENKTEEILQRNLHTHKDLHIPIVPYAGTSRQGSARVDCLTADEVENPS